MKRSQLFTFFLTLLPHDRTVRLFHHCHKAKRQYDNSVIIGAAHARVGSLKSRLNGFSSNFEREKLLKLGFSTSATSQCPSSTSPCPQLRLTDRLTSTT